MAKLAENTDHTLRLTGRWPFASNCEQAAWIGLGTTFRDELFPRLAFVPTSNVTIHPTWDVTGLRATASNDVTVDDLQIDIVDCPHLAKRTRHLVKHDGRNSCLLAHGCLRIRDHDMLCDLVIPDCLG
jgi:hypothetical protein